MYERHIVLPPSGQCPGVFQTKASLLRCADKHRICDYSKDKRQKQAQAPSGQALVSHTVIRVPLTCQCLLRCAYKHSVSALKTKDKTKKQKTKPCRDKIQGQKASMLLVICCGYSHHECHTCFAAHISTKLLILLFY